MDDLCGGGSPAQPGGGSPAQPGVGVTYRARPDDPLHIRTNALTNPDDVKAALATVALCREIGNAPP